MLNDCIYQVSDRLDRIKVIFKLSLYSGRRARRKKEEDEERKKKKMNKNRRKKIWKRR